jgi:hypothetical protein
MSAKPIERLEKRAPILLDFDQFALVQLREELPDHLVKVLVMSSMIFEIECPEELVL